MAAVVAMAMLLALAQMTCKVDTVSFMNERRDARQSESRVKSHNVWVVLVGSSRNWLNYRDNGNVLALYRSVRRLGVPDDHIILMLADNMACNLRNPHPAQVFHSPDHRLNLYGSYVEVDYRGQEVTAANFLLLLTARHPAAVPNSKRLRSDRHSRILIYLTGHGGDKFLKFLDKEEMQAHDLADAVHQMHQQGRYHSILFIVDSCQAATLYSQVYSPGFLGLASSAKGENSYSYSPDMDLGVSVVDRFTFYALQFLERIDSRSNASLQHLISSFDSSLLRSTFCFSDALFNEPIDEVPVTSFFGSVVSTVPWSLPFPFKPLNALTHSPNTNPHAHNTNTKSHPTPSPSHLSRARSTQKDTEPNTVGESAGDRSKGSSSSGSSSSGSGSSSSGGSRSADHSSVVFRVWSGSASDVWTVRVAALVFSMVVLLASVAGKIRSH